jgi:hypothetical protein
LGFITQSDSVVELKAPQHKQVRHCQGTVLHVEQLKKPDEHLTGKCGRSKFTFPKVETQPNLFPAGIYHKNFDEYTQQEGERQLRDDAQIASPTALATTRLTP